MKRPASPPISMPVLAPAGRANADQVDGLFDLHPTRFGVDDDTGILQIDQVLFLQTTQFGQDLVSRSDTVEIENNEIAHDAAP